MIRHVVLFEWADTATEEKKKEAIERLRALPERVPAIRSLSVGLNLGDKPDNFDLALIADFEDMDGYVAYRDHQEHQAAVKDYVRPIINARVAVQYEISGEGPTA